MRLEVAGHVRRQAGENGDSESICEEDHPNAARQELRGSAHGTLLGVEKGQIDSLT